MLNAQHTTYEAELANTISGAAIENEHAGFTGSGYVNFDNQPGGFITWNVNMLEDTIQTFYFVFANGGGSARPMQLMINDTVVEEALNFSTTMAWTNYDTVSVNSLLITGLNEIKLTGFGSEGGPNLDKMMVTGLTGPNLYQLNLSGIGGTITADPLREYYVQDSMVTLTAIADEGYEFSYWLGDINGNENPITINMNSNKNISAVFELVTDTTIVVESTSPVGFATLNGGTTGGAGGDTLYINDAQTFVDLMSNRDGSIASPLVLLISGTITGYDDMIDMKRTANISLIGVSDSASFLGFGIKIVQSNNIIVRNITFADCKVEEKDGLTVDESSNIWIDHCTFTDSPSVDPGGNDHDGLLDVKRGSHNVTISFNYFTNHRKTALLGHSVNETGDTSITVTYYANWFDGTNSRHPRVRYGRVHLLNNLYTNLTGYGVGVTCDAQVLLEGNYFEGTSSPVLISQVNDFSTLSGDPQGFLRAVANYTVGSGEITENLSGYNFDPADYYSYTALDSHLVKNMVSASAGAGKITESVPTSITKKIYNRNPVEYVLKQNYPNPFNPLTTIEYKTDTMEKVVLKVYDLSGKEIAILVNEPQVAGEYSIKFDASGLASGVYVYQLRVGSTFIKSRKFILLK
jgi:pectate lyase